MTFQLSPKAMSSTIEMFFISVSSDLPLPLDHL